MSISDLRAMSIITVQVAISAIMTTAVLGASAKEPTRDLLAAQIRDQGYSCDKPLSAERDAVRSKPDEAVWVLRCENATYRMRLDPDMAARVERLD
jgi:hypothetical protein